MARRRRGKTQYDRIDGLFREYADVVFRTCLFRLGNVHAAEDATQDVFVKAYVKLPDHLTEAQAKVWLITCANRHCIDLLKTASRRELAQPNPEVFEKVPTDEDVRDQTSAIVAFMLSLPRKMSLCAYLHYVEKYPVSEVAQFLSMSASTVRTHCSEARRRMRNWIDEGGLHE